MERAGKAERVGAVSGRVLKTSSVGSGRAPGNDADGGAESDPEISRELLSFVNDLFLQLTTDYPLTWSAQFKGEDGEALVRVARKTWAKRLVGFTPRQIWRAYERMMALPQYAKFAATPNEFRALCLAVRDYDDEHEAFLQRRQARLSAPKPSAAQREARRQAMYAAIGRPCPPRDVEGEG